MLTSDLSPFDRIRRLPIWGEPVNPVPLAGGITNLNYFVQDGARQAVVRIGADIPVHGVMRFNERAASTAAHAAGVSPAILYAEPGIMVIDWIDGTSLTAGAIRAPGTLERIIPLIRQAHQDIPKHLRGPSLIFWVFHVIRDYAATLHEGQSRHMALLPDLLASAAKLQSAVGPVDLVYGHNDLLPANILDDGERLWLIDWDYAGWNSPLFDLGGLASNNGLSPEQEKWMLEAYFDHPATPHLLHRYRAMKAASALREVLWSMVSEIHSALDVDFKGYTATTLAAYHAAITEFTES